MNSLTLLPSANKIRPARQYTDYCLAYRMQHGNIKGCLSLLAFCRRLEKGKVVKAFDIDFKYEK